MIAKEGNEDPQGREKTILQINAYQLVLVVLKTTIGTIKLYKFPIETQEGLIN